MPDIFISYSRKDSQRALELAERLRSEGFGIWIDQRGIEGAEHWATEIAEGIRACSTFIVLLSEHSLASDHVLRELSLATEKGKRVLPIELEPTILSSSFEYPLAGLQRVAISDFDGILRAHKHGVEHIAARDNRKSLMILPFEDLSPTGEDNSWFADGLTGELINTLSNIKSLRVTDRKTAMSFKGYHGRTSEIGRELDVRYFIEGNVRKFGDEMKISLELLDIESGNYLWQHSYRGQFKDIFDVQEAVAHEVVLGLKLHLTPSEQEKVVDHGTENAEAYELYVKANEYLIRQTKEGFQIAIKLLTEAIELDPNYANAHRLKANALASLFGAADQDPALLTEAESLAKEALRIKPTLYVAYYALAHVYLHQGKIAEAEAMGKEFIRMEPENYLSHFSLAYVYGETGQCAKSIGPFEEAVRLRPDYLENIFNLAIACDEAGEKEKCAEWAAFAVPRYERYLKLHPDDEARQVAYASLLYWCGRREEAVAVAERMSAQARDGFLLFNVACLFGDFQDHSQALETCRKAVEAGFRYQSSLLEFLNYDVFIPLHETLEYKAVREIVTNLPGARIA